MVQSINVRRYGKNAPLPARHHVRAGPVQAILEAGHLRYLTVGGVEVLRGIYAAVRDHNWGTPPATFTRYDVQAGNDHFEVRFTAEYHAGDIDFTWDGTIKGAPDGTIEFVFDGFSRSAFRRNRMGFCVLHPMRVAGFPATVQAPDGSYTGGFPTLVSPHQPFFNIQEIRYPIDQERPDAGSVSVAFSGDLFEMEDQRNWTDASFKTYCTPLSLPIPVRVNPGDRVRQSVTIRLQDLDEAKLDGAASSVVEASHGPSVTVGSEPVGMLPPIGLVYAHHAESLDDATVKRLQAIAPAHLHVTLDTHSDDWRERLWGAARDAAVLDAALEAEVIAGDSGEGLDAVIPALAKAGVPIARVHVYPSTGNVSTAPPLARAHELAAEHGLDTLIGGGSRSWFTEFNRAELPLDQMRVATYTINPQVHAFDNSSIIETLEAQAVTVASAKAIVGDRPLAVGPVMLRWRFNPNATGPPVEVAPDQLPDHVDPRQLSLFAAGWVVGSLRYLAQAGASSITSCETIGWCGVIERRDRLSRRDEFPSVPGAPFPVYFALAAVGAFAGAQLIDVETDAPLVSDVLALQRRQDVRVLLTNVTNDPQTVTVHVPSLTNVTIAMMDEGAIVDTLAENAGFQPRSDVAMTKAGPLSITLKPFAVAKIDGVRA